MKNRPQGFTVCGKGLLSRPIGEEHSSGAKARIDSFGFMRGLKPPPPSEFGFSAACEAVAFQSAKLFRGFLVLRPRDFVLCDGGLWYPTLGAKTKTRRGWGTRHWYSIKRSET